MAYYTARTICILTVLIITLQGCRGAPDTAPDTTPVELTRYSATSQPYRLKAGDTFDVKFFYNPELNENITIRPDGKIALQLVGSLTAEGLTPEELDEILTQKYSMHLQETEIAVILREYAGYAVYVGGEVHRPSMIECTGTVDALQAILSAGGFKADAVTSNVVIISKDNEHKPHARFVDVKKILDGEVPQEQYFLKPYDIVFVPKTKLAKADQFVQHLYNFIPPRIGLGFSYELHNEPADTKRTQVVTD